MFLTNVCLIFADMEKTKLNFLIINFQKHFLLRKLYYFFWMNWILLHQTSICPTTKKMPQLICWIISIALTKAPISSPEIKVAINSILYKLKFISYALTLYLQSSSALRRPSSVSGCEGGRNNLKYVFHENFISESGSSAEEHPPDARRKKRVKKNDNKEAPSWNIIMGYKSYCFPGLLFHHPLKKRHRPAPLLLS